MRELKWLFIVIAIGLTVRYYTAVSSTALWLGQSLTGIIHSFTHTAPTPPAPSSPKNSTAT